MIISYRSITITVVYCLTFFQLIGQEVPISELGSDGPDSMLIEEEYPEPETLTIDRSKRDRIDSKNGLKGYYNKEGELTIPHLYKFMERIRLATLFQVVTNNNLQGVISPDNKVIIEPIYDGIYPLKFPSNLYTAKIKRDAVLLNKDGKILVSPKYSGFRETNVENEVIAIYTHPDKSRNTFLIDTLGNILHKYNYRDVFKVSNNLDYLYTRNDSGRVGVIAKDGTVLIPANYKDISFILENLFNVKDTLRREGIVTNTNEVLIPIEYTDVGYGKKNDSIYRFYLNKDSKNYVADALGKIIIDYEPHKRIYDQSDYYFILGGNSKSEVKDVSGNVVIPSDTLVKRALCASDDKNPQIKIEGKNGKYALYSFEAKQLTKYEYDKNWICRHRGTLYQVSKNGKHGIIDRMGMEIIPFIYDKTIIDVDKIYGIIGDTKTLIKTL